MDRYQKRERWLIKRYYELKLLVDELGNKVAELQRLEASMERLRRQFWNHWNTPNAHDNPITPPAHDRPEFEHFEGRGSKAYKEMLE